VYIAIIDYGLGNVKSISNAIGKVGGNFLLTKKHEDIVGADGVILPGVGAFRKGMDNLNKYNLTAAINEFINTKKPFLGICLGMQMLLDESEEFGITQGLGLIKGRIIKLPTKERLPHVGWNEIREPYKGRWHGTMFECLQCGADVYFVHSFVAVPESADDVISTTIYGGHEFCSAIQKDNVYGCQFHPEKSGKIGLMLMEKFIDLARGKKHL
jgi:glutamine amidotransferase